MEKDKMAKVEMSFSFINGSVFNAHPRYIGRVTIVKPTTYDEHWAYTKALKEMFDECVEHGWSLISMFDGDNTMYFSFMLRNVDEYEDFARDLYYKMNPEEEERQWEVFRKLNRWLYRRDQGDFSE